MSRWLTKILLLQTFLHVLFENFEAFNLDTLCCSVSGFCKKTKFPVLYGRNYSYLGGVVLDISHFSTTNVLKEIQHNFKCKAVFV